MPTTYTASALATCNGATLRKLATEHKLAGRSKLNVTELRAALIRLLVAEPTSDATTPVEVAQEGNSTILWSAATGWTDKGDRAVTSLDAQGRLTITPVEVAQEARTSEDAQEAPNGAQGRSQGPRGAFTHRRGSKDAHRARRRIQRASRKRNRR